ncbi:hypothetical protein [Mameliella alba]|uniref:hypothetical protein n=1 Tax=Mameliella alba TaxID=561184 RepID=UPI000B534D28|nr:hypothetical protein [Mameliella alba]MBY6119236.1 hypothetical protein [Mameliella alba]OWV45111.1 hypothetical protein CDZ95_05205 [Mameliella alba]OWV66762.1 hypothetical protein CDZ97_06050 [Mameliella alba]
MKKLRPQYLAAWFALAVAAGGAEADPPETLRLAQGLDINTLLKDGPASPAPESNRPADLTDLLRGTPAPGPEAMEVPSPLPAARAVSAFPDTALAGKWTGQGTGCSGVSITFTIGDAGFDGHSLWTDPDNGSILTTRVTARADRTRAGKTLPGQPDAYLSFARQYAARITRTDASGRVANMLDDYPVTLLVAHDPDAGGLVLRFVEPVTPCAFTRSDQ